MGKLLDYESMTASVSAVDWARLAAFIDGEGTIYINKQKRGKSTYSPRHFLSVVVTSTSPLLMNWLKETFFGSVYIVKGGLSPLAKKVLMRWQLNAQQGRLVLAKCLPYFVIKKQQAEIGLAFCALCSNVHRAKLTVNDLNLRESYRLKIHEANRDPRTLQ